MPGVPDGDVIVVSLVGGLGNQMFQYALGRRLAERTGARLVLDTGWFPTQTKQAYGLGAFALDVDLVDSAAGAPSGGGRTLPIVRERGFHFQPEVLDAQPSCYVTGFWQSERYFVEVADRIRKDFALVAAAGSSSGRGGEADAMVGVHVRRGDYVAEPETNAYHGTCSVDYYRRAMQLLRELVPGARFLLFSDDPAWVHDHLAAADAELAGDPTSPPHRDMALMARCRHQVIANSSFSWWSAWLAEPGGFTIAPRPWFLTPDNNTKDLLPRDWITIGS